MFSFCTFLLLDIWMVLCVSVFLLFLFHLFFHIPNHTLTVQHHYSEVYNTDVVTMLQTFHLHFHLELASFIPFSLTPSVPLRFYTYLNLDIKY